MGYEDNFLDVLNRRPLSKKEEIKAVFDDPRDLDKLCVKAERMIGSTESDIDYEEFVKAGIYPLDKVLEDTQALRIKEKSFLLDMTPEREKAKKIATILEAILAVGITHSGWYGDKVRIYPPSKYDDYVNGIDGILEFGLDDKESDYLALGIDVTFRNLKEELFKKKVGRLLRKIREGEPAKVKYFQSYSGELMPEFAVPNIVLSFDLSTAQDLAYNFKNLSNSVNKEKLKNHKVRYEIIAQIIGECNLLAEYARKHNQPEIAEAYEAIPKTLEKIAEENPNLGFLFAEVGRDRVTERIKEIITSSD